MWSYLLRVLFYVWIDTHIHYQIHEPHIAPEAEECCKVSNIFISNDYLVYTIMQSTKSVQEFFFGGST